MNFHLVAKNKGEIKININIRVQYKLFISKHLKASMVYI